MSRRKPVTEAELRQAARLLTEYRRGLNKQAREREFGSDRDGRRIISELVSRGMARVVNVKDPVLGDVQKLASNDEEWEHEKRTIGSRIRELERRYDGLSRAPAEGVQLSQRSLFE